MPYKDKNSPEARRTSQECAKRYYEKNKEKISQKNKDPERIKALTISRWKNNYKVICDDFNSLYDKYKSSTNCEKCNKEFNNENHNDKKCLDHDHETGLFRNMLCMRCNKDLRFEECNDEINKKKIQTKEKKKQERKQYYANLNKEEKKKKDAEYYEKNKEKIKERVRLWRLSQIK